MENISLKQPCSQLTKLKILNNLNNRLISFKDFKCHLGNRSLQPISKGMNAQKLENTCQSNFLNTNKSDLIKLHKATKSHTFKEGLNTFIFSTENFVNEKDSTNLLNYYHVNEKKHEDEYDLEAQREIFSKFNIQSSLKLEEKQNISRNLKSIDKVYNSKILNKEITMQCCVTDDEYFENPFKSYSQLKINKDIYANVVNIYANRLQKSYVEKYKKVRIKFLISFKMD